MMQFDDVRWRFHMERQPPINPTKSAARQRHKYWTAFVRRRVADWLREVCTAQHLPNKTYFAAILYMDLYLDSTSAKCVVHSNRGADDDITPQRLGTTCLFLASLLHSRSDFDHSIAYYDATATDKQIEKMAATVFALLGGELYVYSTQYDCLRCFGITENRTTKESFWECLELDCVDNLALFYLEAAAQSETVATTFSRPVIATACYALAMRDQCSFADLARATSISPKDILLCARAIFHDVSTNTCPYEGLSGRYAMWTLEKDGKDVPMCVQSATLEDAAVESIAAAGSAQSTSLTLNAKLIDQKHVVEQQKHVVEQKNNASKKRKSSAMSSSEVPCHRKKVPCEIDTLFENRYQCLSVIGDGSYGKVLSCRPIIDQCIAKPEFAVKRFINKFTDAPVLRELCILSAIDHPRIVCATQIFIDLREQHLLQCRVVMPLLTGPNLHEHLKTSGAMSTEHVRRLVYQLCDAVAYLHQNNILHRDIKSKNIVLNSDLSALTLVDFSVSRITDRCDTDDDDDDDDIGDGRHRKKARTAADCPVDTANEPERIEKQSVDVTERNMTTVWYSPPELLETSSFVHDKSCDLWSMACVMMEMITGTALLRGASQLDQLRLIIRFLGPLRDDEKQLLETSFMVYFQSCKCGSSLEGSLRDKGVVDADTVDLLSNWLCYIPQRRLAAKTAMQHAYFAPLFQISSQ